VRRRGMAKRENRTDSNIKKCDRKIEQLSLDFEPSSTKHSSNQLGYPGKNVFPLFRSQDQNKPNPVIERLLLEAKRLKW